MNAAIKQLWDKLTSSSRMLYYFVFISFIFFSMIAWPWDGALYTTQFVPYMLGGFVAAAGGKTWTDIRKMKNGEKDA